MVGAYYYAWYRGRWLDKVSGPPPSLGEYDNTVHGPVVREHMREMSGAGVDFVAVSWDANTYIEHVFEAASAAGLRVTVLYESLTRASGRHKKVTRDDGLRVAEDLALLDEYLGEPCWLRVDDKPVVMIYVTRNYQEDETFDAIRDAIGRAYLVGDEVFWGHALRPARMAKLDALTSYNWYQPGRFSGDGDQAADSFVANVERELASLWMTVPYWPVAMPGYDDTGVRPQKKHPILPRGDGRTFRATLGSALARRPPTLMVTSYSEWYEGTQVESSPAYGSLYLNALRDAARGG